ncbi:26S proteasome non-ATPase regulatory subunit 1 [Artemisia annua]|uniref:26S proteasome non-ATPase regulatory subunit 1 n=1 Tax=Artemisia annua TaxID=35608 RepID=A0A2U1LIZ6_ARTAN|nr:26S proteasome non-ATPase regulatory subunit 1 [Artemisia annua]
MELSKACKALLALTLAPTKQGGFLLASSEKGSTVSNASFKNPFRFTCSITRVRDRVVQHGACFGTADEDSAVAGGAVAISMGLLMAGTSSEKATLMLVYAHEIQEQKYHKFIVNLDDRTQVAYGSKNEIIRFKGFRLQASDINSQHRALRLAMRSHDAPEICN